MNTISSAHWDEWMGHWTPTAFVRSIQDHGGGPLRHALLQHALEVNKGANPPLDAASLQEVVEALHQHVLDTRQVERDQRAKTKATAKTAQAAYLDDEVEPADFMVLLRVFLTHVRTWPVKVLFPDGSFGAHPIECMEAWAAWTEPTLPEGLLS